MILPVYTYNHPVLRQKTAPVSELTEDIVSLVESMFATMYNANGIGLAANQVGRGLALAVIDASEMDDTALSASPIVMINPVIESFSDEEEEFEEGCLSLPELRDIVVRPSAVQVRFLDTQMKEHHMETTGLLARVMQHEIDHLNGIYFFERLTPIRRTLAQSKLKRIAKGLVETEYEIV